MLGAAIVAAASAVTVPAGALADGLSAAPEAEAEPGISITGLGFARSRSGSAQASGQVAVARAVRNARARAGAVAAALGVGVGAVEEISLRGPGQFGERRPSSIAAAAATVRFAILGAAADRAGSGRRVEADGAAFAPVRPGDPDRSRSIKRAMLVARRKVTPEAAAVARRSAGAAAHSAGLRLAGVVSVAEAPAPYYGPSGTFYDPALGSFGPGRFCGVYHHPVVRADPRTGLPRVVRRVSRRGCTFQTTYGAHLEVAYSAQPG
jgi:hypothetical protein